MKEDQWLDLWSLNISKPVPAETLRRWYGCLAPNEADRADRYRAYHRREQAIASRALLRHALSFRRGGQPEDWQIEEDEKGRPRLTDLSTSIDFNITHTNGMVACAMSSGFRVGVDVENDDRASEMYEVRERFLSQVETEIFSSLDAPTAANYLVQLWTLKEAWAKALGEGLRVDFTSAEFEISDNLGTGAIRLVNSPEWKFRQFPQESEYLISLAWLGHDDFDVRAKDAALLMGCGLRFTSDQ